MSDVTVSINLSRAEQGKLYMKSLKQAERITQLKDGLREIRDMAEQIGTAEAFAIRTKAAALLEAPK